MDKILINELKVETIIGCFAWERQVKQAVLIDLEIDFDTKAAGNSDNLKQTLDYHLLASVVTEFVANSQFKLIEALAEQIAQLILEKFTLTRIAIKISKIAAIPQAKSVSVSIIRP